MTARKIVSKKRPAKEPATATQPAVAKSIATRKPATAKPTEVKPKFVKNIEPSTKLVPIPKDLKPKKVKLIRDSFAMPSFDYDLIDVLKDRARGDKAIVKKSELLRAGLHALDKLDANQLIAAVGSLALVKTGRPKK